MSNVIDSSRAEKANVQKYHFKVIGSDLAKKEDSIAQQVEALKEEFEPLEQKEIESKQEVQEKETVESKKEPKKQKDDTQSTFVEELLKKTDELSSNIIKLQMQMETQQEDFKTRLTQERERAYEDGFKGGEEKAFNTFKSELDQLRAKFTSSIAKIEKMEQTFDNKLSQIESNLSTVAIDIAKEVIDVEVESRSEQIAYNLAKQLISQIKEATHIEIKVSMDDYEYLKENFKDNKTIEIIADDAIASGGVVILSDLGNIDGDLSVRLQKVKELLLNHKE